MMTLKRLRTQRGYTLVELMVVAGIMGLVIMSMYSLYLNTAKTSSTTEEVIEVQQNLRIALEQMKKDMRMAGFLVPTGAPFSSAPMTPSDDNGDGDCVDGGEFCLTIQTATSFGVATRINLGTGGILSIADTIGAATPQDFTVILSSMVDQFSVDDSVRFIRPGDANAVKNATVTATVSSVDRTVPRVSLDGLNSYGGDGTDEIINNGDVLVRVPAGSTHPNTIQYFLQDDPDSADVAMHRLIRNDGTGNQVVANKISDLQFIYLLDDGSETTAPAAADLINIRAVRIIFTGQTDATLTGQAKFSGVKTRQAVGVVSLRNR